jgi:putative nucleotidyltransferase with HDIG domain
VARVPPPTCCDEAPAGPAAPAAYAPALGLPPEALTAAAAPPSDAVEAAVRDVRAHFARHRPPPASFPAVALRILDLVARPEMDLGELARQVRIDGALASGLLALANSAAYRGVRRIETVRDAMARLGLNEVAKLASAISTRSLHGPAEKAEQARHAARWDRHFLHAATVARGASELFRFRAQKVAGSEQVFMAGLLHDVGRSLALRSLAALQAGGAHAALDDAQVDQVVDLAHVAVGAELHAQWRMPDQFALAAAHHHDRAVAPGEHAATVHLVRMISALALLRAEPGRHPRAPFEAVDSARALGVSPELLADAAGRLAADEDWVRVLFAGPARA